jgi:hypothetical protein
MITLNGLSFWLSYPNTDVLGKWRWTGCTKKLVIAFVAPFAYRLVSSFSTGISIIAWSGVMTK